MKCIVLVDFDFDLSFANLGATRLSQINSLASWMQNLGSSLCLVKNIPWVYWRFSCTKKKNPDFSVGQTGSNLRKPISQAFVHDEKFSLWIKNVAEKKIKMLQKFHFLRLWLAYKIVILMSIFFLHFIIFALHLLPILQWVFNISAMYCV